MARAEIIFDGRPEGAVRAGRDVVRSMKDVERTAQGAGRGIANVGQAGSGLESVERRFASLGQAVQLLGSQANGVNLGGLASDVGSLGSSMSGVAKSGGAGALGRFAAKAAPLASIIGPMGPSLMAVGSALYDVAAASTSVADEANDAADALQRLNDVQLEAQGAVLDVKDAELGARDARVAATEASVKAQEAFAAYMKEVNRAPSKTKDARDASKRVSDALHDQRDAASRVADAQRSLTGANERLAESHRKEAKAVDEVKTKRDEYAKVVKDSGKDSKEAVAAAKRIATAEERVKTATASVSSAQRSANAAQKNLTEAKAKHAAASTAVARREQEYQRVLGRGGAGSKAAVEAAKKYHEALRDEEQAKLRVQRADLRLAESRSKQEKATVATTNASKELAKEFGGLTSKAEASSRKIVVTGARTGMVMQQSADQTAKAWADAFTASAANSDTLTASAKETAAGVAGLVVQLGHVPTETEAKIISDALARGEDVDALAAKLGLVPPTTDANVASNAPAAKGWLDGVLSSLNALDGKVVTTTVVTRRVDQSAGGGGDRGPRGAGAATGAWVVPGTRGRGDVVPAMLKPGEVVLNERQQAMIGGRLVRSTLIATGAKRFSSRGRAFAAGRLSSDDSKKKIDALRDSHDKGFGFLDLGLARAEGTKATGDDIAALRKLSRYSRAWSNRYIRTIPRLSGPAAADARREATSLLRAAQGYDEQIASIVRDRRQAEADAQERRREAGRATMEARLEQAQSQLAAARRTSALSEATLAAFGSGGVTVNVTPPLGSSPRYLRESTQNILAGIGAHNMRTPRRTSGWSSIR